eukprot:6039204-Prymnesium_polylepis.1
MLSCSSDPHCTAGSRSTNEICSTGLEAYLTQYHQLKMDCDSPGARAYSAASPSGRLARQPRITVSR